MNPIYGITWHVPSFGKAARGKKNRRKNYRYGVFHSKMNVSNIQRIGNYPGELIGVLWVISFWLCLQNTKIPMKYFLFCFAYLIIFQNIQAQTDKFDSAINANKYIIQFKDHKISGNGVEFILKQTQNSQFVLIGENHNTKEIPQFTNALFNLLRKNEGFQYLALEQDPVMMKILSNGSRIDINEEAKRYPYGFTFITDQELNMISNMIDSSKVVNSVWGCDQSFGASQAVEVIKNYLQAKKIHIKTIDSIFLKISKMESVRKIDSVDYMSDMNKTQDLIAIKNSIPAQYTQAMDFYISSLILSDSMYVMNRHKKYFESSLMRENYMKNRFLEEYNIAKAQTPFPKVVLKFGNVHLTDGFNWITDVSSLGDFARALALSNNKNAFSINALIYRTDSSDWNYFGKDPSTAYLKKIANDISINDWTIIDLRPLKTMYYNGKLKGLITKEERDHWEDLIFGYDCLLLIGNGNDGDVSNTKGEY
jgi:hypothetical protein